MFPNRESWTTRSPRHLISLLVAAGLVYKFKLRPGLKFHNGDPVTAEDVKFSFERYKGTGAEELQARVESGEIADPLTVRFRLKAAWPDFMTFYAAWREKKLRGLFLTAVGNSGNAASRVEAFIYSKGSYSYGGYPDIDELFQQQARERDSAKREALLHRIQQLAIDVSLLRGHAPQEPVGQPSRQEAT